MNPVNPDKRQGPKRFYKKVSVRADGDGFAIGLDANTLKTPGRTPFALPVRALAEAVAEEWRGQGTCIDRSTMPLTALANTAIDQVADNADAVRGDIRAFAASDLLCYRAQSPDGLVRRQQTHWDPVLAWSDTALDAPFHLAGGIMPVEQPLPSLDRITVVLAGVEPLPLAAVHMVTTLTGSALLALALTHGRMDAGAVWRAAHVDEDWQIETWGEDAEARARRTGRRLVFDAAALVLLHHRQQHTYTSGISD